MFPAWLYLSAHATSKFRAPPLAGAPSLPAISLSAIPGKRKQMAHSRLTAAVSAAALVALAASSADVRTPVTPAAPAAASARAEGQIPTRAQEHPGTLIELTDAALWQNVAAGGGVATVGLK